MGLEIARREFVPKNILHRHLKSSPFLKVSGTRLNLTLGLSGGEGDVAECAAVRVAIVRVPCGHDSHKSLWAWGRLFLTPSLRLARLPPFFKAAPFQYN